MRATAVLEEILLDLHKHLGRLAWGYSIINFSQNDQNLDLPPPFFASLHLFDFAKPTPPANVQNFTSTTPHHLHHHYPPFIKTIAKLCYFIDS